MGSKEVSLIPVIISILGMLFESLSGYFQEDVRKVLKPSSFEFMFVNSFYSWLIAVANWYRSSEFNYTFKLFSHSPEALTDQIKANLFTSIGNIFLFMILARRGPIVVALVTTTRKVFTVLLSAYTNNTPLKGTRGLGIGIVCFGVMLECSQSVYEKLFKAQPPAIKDSKEKKPLTDTAKASEETPQVTTETTENLKSRPSKKSKQD